MDPFKNWPLKEIVHFLKTALDLAEYELSRITDADEDKEFLQDEASNEATNMAPVELLKNTPIDKRNAQKFPRPQYGMFNLPIHYTLGRGVLEALGGDVEVALFRAFRAVSRDGDLYGLNYHEFDFQEVGIATDMWWDKYGRCVYLHLELVHTDDAICWEEDDIGEVLQGRPLH